MAESASGGTESGHQELVLAVKQAVSRMYGRFRQGRPAGELGDGALGVLIRVEKRGPVTLTGLCEEFGVTPASMSQTVTRLERAGYVERVRDPEDGRRAIIVATAEGARLSSEARARRDAWLEGHLAELTEAERRTLARAARILLRIAETPEERPAAPSRASRSR